MKPRMDDKRTKILLREATNQVLLDALHDLQDARKRVAELAYLLERINEQSLTKDRGCRFCGWYYSATSHQHHCVLGEIKQALGEKP